MVSSRSIIAARPTPSLLIDSDHQHQHRQFSSCQSDGFHQQNHHQQTHDSPWSPPLTLIIVCASTLIIIMVVLVLVLMLILLILIMGILPLPTVAAQTPNFPPPGIRRPRLYATMSGQGLEARLTHACPEHPRTKSLPGSSCLHLKPQPLSPMPPSKLRVFFSRASPSKSAPGQDLRPVPSPLKLDSIPNPRPHPLLPRLLLLPLRRGATATTTSSPCQ